LDVLAAFLTAVLSGMGVGGGGILMLYLTLYRRFPTVQAQGINLLCFLCAAVASVFGTPPPKETFSLPKRVFFGMAAVGLIGAAMGSFWSAKLPTRLFRKYFGGFLCLCSVYAWITSSKQPQSPR
jgi:uncharacterized membrane protein YfcA